MKWFRAGRRSPHVEFRDACGSVCDDRCRAAALRNDAKIQVLRAGIRV